MSSTRKKTRKIMSAKQYYVGTDIDVGSMGQTCMVCPYFLEREVKTMEITGIALQTVAAGEDVAFTETPV